MIGSQVRHSAWSPAKKYYSSDILEESVTPTQTWNSNGSVNLSSPTRRGLYYQREYSTNLQTWTHLTPSTQATRTTLSIIDIPTPGERRFYRTRWVAAGS